MPVYSLNILAKWKNTNPAGQQLRDIPATGMNVRFSLAQYAGKNIRIGLYREAVSSSNTGIAIHIVMIAGSLILLLPLPMLTIYLLHYCGQSILRSKLASNCQ